MGNQRRLKNYLPANIDSRKARNIFFENRPLEWIQ